eukprot:3733292-Ditylum_brightwellii.AAC.1
MPKGLKITNITGDILFDSAQIAGVDYNADEFSDQDYTSKSKSDSDDYSDNNNDEEGGKIDQNELADILYDDLPPLIAPGSNSDYNSDSNSNDEDKDNNPFQQADVPPDTNARSHSHSMHGTRNTTQRRSRTRRRK